MLIVKYIFLVLLMVFVNSIHAQMLENIFHVEGLEMQPLQMKEMGVKAFQITSGIVASDPKKKKNYQADFDHMYLVNGDGFVYKYQFWLNEDTITGTTHNPIPGNQSAWIMDADSMLIDSPFIFLYELDKGKYLNRSKYSMNGLLLTYTYYNNQEKSTEKNYYYNAEKLDSVKITLEGSTGFFLAQFVYNEKKRITQVLEYSMHGGTRKLFSTFNYEYREDGLLKSILQTFTESWYFPYETKFQWHFR